MIIASTPSIFLHDLFNCDHIFVLDMTEEVFVTVTVCGVLTVWDKVTMDMLYRDIQLSSIVIKQFFMASEF